MPKYCLFFCMINVREEIYHIGSILWYFSLRLEVDFTFTLDNNQNHNDNNDSDNNPHINIFKGTVLGLWIRDKR